jgi:hypothetical protein
MTPAWLTGLCALVAILLGGRVARAEPARVELSIHCAELTPSARDELSARLLLLIHGAAPPAPVRVAVDCERVPPTAEADWGEQSDSVAIEATGDWVEASLIAVETLLAPSRPAATAANAGEAAPKAQPTPPQASDGSAEPMPPRDEPPLAASRAPRRSRSIGGVSLGLAGEPWPSPARFGWGPRLDLAWGAGSWAGTSFETLRLGTKDGQRLLAFDALVGAAWGAPFGPERLGAVLAIGGEWFSATSSSEPTGERTASSGVLDLGLRWAEHWAPVAVWLSADLRLRLRPLELPDPVDAELSRWSALLSVAVALRVE